jgi:hypothetical protein
VGEIEKKNKRWDSKFSPFQLRNYEEYHAAYAW